MTLQIVSIYIYLPSPHRIVNRQRAAEQVLTDILRLVGCLVAPPIASNRLKNPCQTER